MGVAPQELHRLPEAFGVDGVALGLARALALGQVPCCAELAQMAGPAGLGQSQAGDDLPGVQLALLEEQVEDAQAGLVGQGRRLSSEEVNALV